MSKTRIAVVRGGKGTGYDASLKTGGAILRHIDRDTYTPLDVLIDKEGRWYMNGIEVLPHDLNHRADILWNALHDSHESEADVFSGLSIPHTGSRFVPRTLAGHTARTRETLSRHGIKTPRHVVFERGEVSESDILNIFRSFHGPFSVEDVRRSAHTSKPLRAWSFDELVSAIDSVLQESKEVVVSERVRGKELSVGLVEGLRNEDHYVLLPGERTESGAHAFPARLSHKEKEAVEEAVREAHRILGLRHYSNAEIIVGSDGVYVVAIEPLTDLSESSAFVSGLEAVGCSMPQFIKHVTERGLL